MNEWKIEINQSLVKELEECFSMGQIIDDQGRRFLTEAEFDRLNGLKIEVFSNEHPPPHFRVCFQGVTNNFTISDCTPLNGNALKGYFKNIKKWHKKHKKELIKFWDELRPTDCPVGKYQENA